MLYVKEIVFLDYNIYTFEQKDTHYTLHGSIPRKSKKSLNWFVKVADLQIMELCIIILLNCVEFTKFTVFTIVVYLYDKHTIAFQ